MATITAHRAFKKLMAAGPAEGTVTAHQQEQYRNHIRLAREAIQKLEQYVNAYEHYTSTRARQRATTRAIDLCGDLSRYADLARMNVDDHRNRTLPNFGLRHPYTPDHNTRAHMLWRSLHSLEQRGADIYMEGGLVIVTMTTESVHLEAPNEGEFEFGCYDIHLCLTSVVGGSTDYEIENHDDDAELEGRFIHPHVQNNSLCEGDGRDAIDTARRNWAVDDMLDTIEHLLHQYARGGAYRTLSQWTQETLTCEDCGLEAPEEDFRTTVDGMTLCLRCGVHTMPNDDILERMDVVAFNGVFWDPEYCSPCDRCQDPTPHEHMYDIGDIDESWCPDCTREFTEPCHGCNQRFPVDHEHEVDDPDQEYCNGCYVGQDEQEDEPCPSNSPSHPTPGTSSSGGGTEGATRSEDSESPQMMTRSESLTSFPSGRPSPQDLANLMTRQSPITSRIASPRGSFPGIAFGSGSTPIQEHR